LFDEYAKSNKNYNDLIADLKSALKLIEFKYENEYDKDKKELYRKFVDKINQQIIVVDPANDVNKLMFDFKDVLSIWLDKEKGKTVNKNEIFFDLPKRFETSYHNDMASLNVI
jgi:uncharacterized FlaG/YvyC family protein